MTDDLGSGVAIGEDPAPEAWPEEPGLSAVVAAAPGPQEEVMAAGEAASDEPDEPGLPGTAETPRTPPVAASPTPPTDAAARTTPLPPPHNEAQPWSAGPVSISSAMLAAAGDEGSAGLVSASSLPPAPPQAATRSALAFVTHKDPATGRLGLLLGGGARMPQ